MDYIETLQKARRQRKQILAYRKRGWTFAKIGVKLGISAQRVCKVAGEEKARILVKSNGVFTEK